MHFNQFVLFSTIFFPIIVLIFLWIKWQKLGPLILILLICNLFLLSLGAGKILIYGSMRFDSFTHDLSFQSVKLNDNNKSTFSGKVIINRLKRLSKKIRGKEPVYITNSGYQISLDSFGDQKSINIKKHF